MSEQSLQRIEPMPTSPSVEGMITLAIEKGATVETLERLMAIRREVRAEQAKEAYDRAMAAFQAECPIIKKTKAVSTNSGKVAYKYAPIESIVEQVKELLRAHGFSYSTKMELHERGVKSTVKVTHEGGHSEESPMEVPFGEKTQIMSQSQVAAAATTFAKRYAFLNAFGILTGDEDIDGHTDSVKTPPGDKDKAPAKSPSAPPTPTTPKRDKPTEPKQATEKTRDWFLAEMRKRFDDSVILQFACDAGPPYVLMPNQTLEEWPLEHVPTTQLTLKNMIEGCALFMDVEPRTVGENALKPSESDSDRADASAGDQNAPEGDSERSEGATDDGVETITGKLEAVSVKEGRSGKGPWKRFGVKVCEEWFGTFNSTLGELAKKDKGHTVTIHFKREERGNELIGIERARNT